MRVEEDLEPKLSGDLEQLDEVVNVLFVIYTSKMVDHKRMLGETSIKLSNARNVSKHKHRDEGTYGPECSRASQGTKTRRT